MFQTELFFLALTFSFTWVNINIADLREQLTALCSTVAVCTALRRSRTKLVKYFYDSEMFSVIGA